MRKLGRAAIQNVLKRAKHEFTHNRDSYWMVKFSYRDHSVIATFDPAFSGSGWQVTGFTIVYSRCVVSYNIGVDFPSSDACFDY